MMKNYTQEKDYVKSKTNAKTNVRNVWDGRLRERKNSQNEFLWSDRLRDRIGNVSYKDVDNTDIVNDVYNEIELLYKQSKNK